MRPDQAIQNPTAASPSTADRILLRLKTRGPASASELAGELAMSAEAARQQIQKLAGDGLISSRQAAAARAGRPRQDWELTAAGHARFPDTHAQLTVQLIGSIRQLFGQAGLDKLIEQREVQMRAEYQQHCGRLNSLPRKLEKLAELRSAEGYMARVEKHGKQWLLIEDHCPICAAAQSCQGFCRSELQLFGEVLGGQAEITREEHLLAEGRRCVYRITALASG
ncbi:HTH domain-containing protein [Herbaspirillum seropedicae]|uniref:helix-turn-helix transcriptional regulator n=1 Tax=Herbaspirillum seropedicae TaxID=964 RepID=UPI001121A044|nr:helix-turn-helix domain-containing protein [Herbaspirillum seropedicae]QDD63844.1 HTH domain-containing protein [Herbaspirillum seropedicae]